MGMSMVCCKSISSQLRTASLRSFRDGPKDQTSDVQLHIGESRDSGFASSTRPGMTWKKSRRRNFFIIFVDGIFTTLFERLFTNVFDVTAQTQVIPCVYRGCNAD